MPVKEKCTPDVLYEDKSPVHDVYMPGKKAKRSGFHKTFVKQWREYRELTQEQLAERVSAFMLKHGHKKGYTYASVGRLENGKIGYTQLVLEALADSLGTDAASLLIRDPTDNATIWTIWERALPEERETITEHAEIVLRKPNRA